MLRDKLLDTVARQGLWQVLGDAQVADQPAIEPDFRVIANDNDLRIWWAYASQVIQCGLGVLDSLDIHDERAGDTGLLEMADGVPDVPVGNTYAALIGREALTQCGRALLVGDEGHDILLPFQGNRRRRRNIRQARTTGHWGAQWNTTSLLSCPSITRTVKPGGPAR